MNFLKSFNKIVLLLYKTDVLSEDAILKWYKESHSSRGWSVFMDQVFTTFCVNSGAFFNALRFQKRYLPLYEKHGVMNLCHYFFKNVLQLDSR